MNAYSKMGPGGPSRPSELAMNPRNQEAKARRRAELLAAFTATFGSLPIDDRADLLETLESLAFDASPGVNLERDDLRDFMRRVYAVAGWVER